MQQFESVDRVAEILDIDHVFAESRGGQLRQCNPVTRCGFVRDEFGGSINAKFRLGCSGRSTTPKPSQLFAQRVLSARFTRRCTARTLVSLQNVGCVSALERLDLPAVNLPGVVANCV